ncbi:hypothetical protein BVG19_g2815 [[Candida] boidinii]|nr:hypothetical protein BVG19_g2815 [[Candida] boidinii]OWB52992.1 hypothetical protein B5S27_g4577 [[Candida] boidinii]
MSSSESISVKSGDEVPAYDGFDDQAQAQVNDLARQLTNASRNSYVSSTLRNGEARPVKTDNTLDLIRTLTSMSQIPGTNTFEGDVDPRLDPNNDEFDSKYWIRNFRKLLDSDPEHYRHTSLGIAYRNLRARGVASDADFQENVLNFPYKIAKNFIADNFLSKDESRYFDILKPMDGIIKPGTLTVVLGRPGAGCSTLLKTIAAHTYGFKVDPESKISYDGLTPKDIVKHYRGEVTFSAELDYHFPNLSVGQTLFFAASLRTPSNRVPGVTRERYAEHMRDVYMATYGLLHTKNTKVGNDFIRGVSGGERKRVSIAEVSLCGSKLQCWDNATRGLDAATALEFIKALKTSAVVLDTTPLIAIYQCSQDAYNLFDTAIVLYEGYQIYFGSATKAKTYFEKMGYECPPRQTTADFLTSITSPAERVAKKGFENKVPKTPQEFSEYWRNSPEYEELVLEVDSYIENCEKNNTKEEFRESHVAQQAKHARPGSSYTLSYGMQIKQVCLRDFWRIQADPSITIFTVVANIIMGLILSSLFYNLPSDTGSFYYRTASLFFALLFNAFSSLLELIAMFEAKQIVEKHKKYALYHPSADALASVLTNVPSKFLTSVGFNLIYYFMVHYRREPGRFFFYWLCSIVSQFAMSHLFRIIGCFFSTLSESMTPASVILLALVIYTGFAIPTPNMHGWSRWINYLDPIAYTFESLLTNEFSGVEFPCTAFVPDYDDVSLEFKTCSAVSAIPGYSYINGSDYLAASYNYHNSHKWRNIGIAFAFVFGFLGIYLGLVELSKGAMQKGEVILFQQSTLRKLKKERKLAEAQGDIEGGHLGEKPAGMLEDVKGGDNIDDGVNKLVAGKDIFHWRDVCYDVKIKSETRRILNHVDGWVKPGTLTALMGASGAGKTTLLDVLANRVTMGVISGSMFVNGHLRGNSFQRSTGYVQQQDLHLMTSTVREALRFSAYLRQGRDISKAEKDEYVENVISILEMQKYADAIVGVSGEGLNVEQRKRLTIGVELAAKPQLLLFLDEPTSGLDSQTAWSICQLMRKLANSGQAVLCTIHQPSAILLQEFDRLLFLARGGRTVYFGDLGENCQSMIDYFEKYDADPCPSNANPAEWMLEVIGAAPGSHAKQDYHEVWLNSSERKAVRDELIQMENELVKLPMSELPDANAEFASSFMIQYWVVTIRVFQQYFRTPTYIWSKFFLMIMSSLFNGFSFFKADTSQQGLQNQMLSVFMFTVVCNTLIQQYLPNYIYQRDIYEVRERPSKTFHWATFILAQVTAEIPWNILVGTVGYFCWYYPVGLYRNASLTDTVAVRGAYTWLLIVAFTVYCNTLGQLCIAAIDSMDNAANIASLLFTLSLNFCGVLLYPTGFWIFMYRCSPFTYWIAGILSAAVKDADVVCADNEYATIIPPSGMTCGDYMADYITDSGGYLLNSDATDQCSFCAVSETNAFLRSIHIEPDNMWRDWGIFICYIGINIIGTILLYWWARVPKSGNKVRETADEIPVTNPPPLDESESTQDDIEKLNTANSASAEKK